MTNAEIREIVDRARRCYLDSSRGGHRIPVETFLEYEIGSALGEFRLVGLIDRPTVKAMMRAAKAAIRGDKGA